MSELENAVVSEPVRLTWLEERLSENGNLLARENDLMAKIIELEDRYLVLEKQAIHAMRLAEYWRDRAGSSNETAPFPWEEQTDAEA